MMKTNWCFFSNLLIFYDINMINYTFIYLALKRNVQWEKLLDYFSTYKYLIDLRRYKKFQFSSDLAL